MDIFLQVSINGLTIGLLYVLMALGLTLIFGVMDVINFAHGEFYMLGAFFTYIATVKLQMSFFISLSLAVLIVAILAIFIERIVFRPLIENPLNVLIVSLAVSIFLQHIAQLSFGPDNYKIPSPAPGVFVLGDLYFPKERLFAAGVSILFLFGLYLIIFHTKFGRAMRAVAQDPESAALQGVKISRIYMLSFSLGCGLAAAAGGLIGPIFSANAFMGTMAVVKAFVVIILAGLGSIRGAVIGGLVLGVVESFGATFLGTQYCDMMGFALIMLVLIVKPSGLFGTAVEKA